MVHPSLRCYKTEERWIAELKEKGKFEEWVSLGSRFGVILWSSFSRFVDQTPYQYYNMDGNIIFVSMIQTKYRDDTECIPVFKQKVVKNHTNVDQSKYRIVEKTERLSTAGLATCTGLAMVVGSKKFMAHLDACTPTHPIKRALRELIQEESADVTELRPIIYAGSLNSELTQQSAMDICEYLGIPAEKCYVKMVCFMERVYI